MDIHKVVKEMTDDQLYAALLEHNLPAGPILPSTRAVYEIKLLGVLNGEDVPRSSPGSGSVSPENRVRHSPKKSSPEPKPDTPVSRHSFTRYLTGGAGHEGTYDSVRNDDGSSTSHDSSSYSRYSSLNSQPAYDSLHEHSQPLSHGKGVEEQPSSRVALMGVFGFVLLIIAIILALVWQSPDPYSQLEMEVKDKLGKITNKDEH